MSIVSRWIKECRGGNKDACIRWYLYGWLGPLFLKELQDLVGPVALVPIPKPSPGPEEAPLLDTDFLRDVDLVRVAFGSPNLQANVIPIKEQLKAATEFHAALEKGTKSLDAEIIRLQKQNVSGR